MVNAIQEFVDYLHSVRKMSHNTEVCYERDLKKMALWLENQGVDSLGQITGGNLHSYVLHLEQEQMSAATISRKIASMRAFFQYEEKKHALNGDPSRKLKPPKVEKKTPDLPSADEVKHLLRQPDEKTVKGMRDKAMLGLMYSTGVRVSELISLKLSDLKLDPGYIICKGQERDRIHAFDTETKNALERYLSQARRALLGDAENDTLFLNCSGQPMSRQGFWKVLKGYVSQSELKTDITAHTLRHSHIMQH